MKKISKSLFSTLLLTLILVVGTTFILTSYFNSRNGVTVYYDAEPIAVSEFDFTQIYEMFDEINLISGEDENIKCVESSFKLAGTSLNDVHYTSNVDEQNIAVTSLTTINQVTDFSTLNMILDYGDCQDYVEAEGYDVGYENGKFTGTVVIDGIEYSVEDVIRATYGEDGTQQCWFWFIIKIVIVVVNVIVTAITAYDIYKYLTAEEVTIEGVVSIVAEGLVCTAASALTCGIGASLAKTGFKILKKGKKIVGDAEHLLGLEAKTILNQRTQLVKEGKRSFGHSYPRGTGDNSIREAYKKQTAYKDYNWNDSSREDYVEIHHFVEQSQAGKKFDAREIHTDLNTVGIPKVMHHKISGIYSSKTEHKTIIDEIFGKGFFDGQTTFREFVHSKSYEEQYEIGVKVFNYFVGKQSPNGTKYFALSL